jgi:hypothetical protein
MLEGQREEARALCTRHNRRRGPCSGGASATKFTVQRGSLGAWGVGGSGVRWVLTSEIYTEGGSGWSNGRRTKLDPLL